MLGPQEKGISRRGSRGPALGGHTGRGEGCGVGDPVLRGLLQHEREGLGRSRRSGLAHKYHLSLFLWPRTHSPVLSPSPVGHERRLASPGCALPGQFPVNRWLPEPYRRANTGPFTNDRWRWPASLATVRSCSGLLSSCSHLKKTHEKAPTQQESDLRHRRCPGHSGDIWACVTEAAHAAERILQSQSQAGRAGLTGWRQQARGHREHPALRGSISRA